MERLIADANKVFLSTPFSQKATKIQLLFNKLIAVAGTNVGMNAF